MRRISSSSSSSIAAKFRFSSRHAIMVRGLGGSAEHGPRRPDDPTATKTTTMTDAMTKTTTESTKDQVDRMRRVLREGGGTRDDDDRLRGDDDADITTHDEGWEALWREGVTPWDLGGPTGTLMSELERKRRDERETLQRWRTALIPGCGAGHDVLALARFLDGIGTSTETNSNFPTMRTVVGLDVSPTSLGRAKGILMDGIGRGDHSKRLQHTDVRLYLGDFFEEPSTWALFHHEKGAGTNSENSRGLHSGQTFDFIFDYTFFCAIPPHRRREWGRQMTRLVTRNDRSDDVSGDRAAGSEEKDPRRQPFPNPMGRGGQLLTLMFPYVTTARPDSPGPPHVVTFSDYQEALDFHDCEHLRLTTRAPYESADTVPGRRGQELVGWWSFETLKTKAQNGGTTLENDCSFSQTR
jgi:SAM-dependent methyltransferase